MCKHWGLHISTNINCLGAVLGSFWVVWRGLLWCLKAKLRSWWFPRYWWFNKQYHGGYQLICLISRPLLIASKRDWYWSKGLFKGFKPVLRPWESLKNWWRYGRMKFMTTTTIVTIHFISHSPHITHHVTTLSCIVTVRWPFCDWCHTFCDCDMTPFPHSTFIVVIQLNKRNENRK